MPKILLTGATGFLGSHLLESFILQGFDVIVLKRSTSNTKRIDHLLSSTQPFDVDKKPLKEIFETEKPDIVVHTACNYGRDNKSLTGIVNSNLFFGLDLLENAINTNAETFINTDTLLPKEVNDYSLSKAHMAEWLRKYSNQIQVTNIKIEHMYGLKDDNKKFIPWLIHRMIDDEDEIKLTSGVQKRDFVYIDDVVSAYNLVVRKRGELKSWNGFDLGTGIFTCVKDMVLTIAKEIERIKKNSIIPRLKFGEISYRKGDIMVPELNNSSLISLGWKPKLDIKEGIIKILKETL